LIAVVSRGRNISQIAAFVLGGKNEVSVVVFEPFARRYILHSGFSEDMCASLWKRFYIKSVGAIGVCWWLPVKGQDRVFCLLEN